MLARGASEEGRFDKNDELETIQNKDTVTTPPKMKIGYEKP